MTQASISRVEDFPEVANSGGMLEVAQSRAAQEVQAAMIVAQRFPRDQNKSFTRIMAACKRRALAERSSYAYPKGGQSVSGPSIRLAETLAREWGNIDFGIVELEQRDGESTIMSYAWDLETNTRSTKIFSVKHLRHTKKGSYKLEDPREVYEMTANQGARRLRACILAIIPGDILDSAMDECERTLASGNREPLIDRVRKMLAAFGEMGITQEMVEKKLGHNLAAISEQEFVSLRKIYTSLKDGFGSREEFFEITPVNGRVADAQQSKQDDPNEPPPPPAPAGAAPKTPEGGGEKASGPSPAAPVSGRPRAKKAEAAPAPIDSPAPDGDPRTKRDIASDFAAELSPVELKAFIEGNDGRIAGAKAVAKLTGPWDEFSEPDQRKLAMFIKLALLSQ